MTTSREIRRALCKTKSKSEIEIYLVCLIEWLEQSRKRKMAKQTNGIDEDSVIIIGKRFFYLLRNNPLLIHAVIVIYYRSF